MALGSCPDAAVERGDVGEDVATGMYQGLEDRYEFRGKR